MKNKVLNLVVMAIVLGTVSLRAQLNVGSTRTLKTISFLELNNTKIRPFVPINCLTGRTLNPLSANHFASLIKNNTGTEGNESATTNGSAVFTIGAQSSAVNVLDVNVAPAANTVTFPISEVTEGTWKISTTTIDGVSYSGSGTVTKGSTSIMLTESGTPTKYVGANVNFATNTTPSVNAIVKISDKIADQLSGEDLAAYTSAAANTWIAVTLAEYNCVTTNISGTKAGATDATMATSATDTYLSAYTFMDNGAFGTKLAASSYVVAIAYRSYKRQSSPNGIKLKLGATVSSGYTDYPTSTIFTPSHNTTANTIYYYVMKSPSIVSSAAAMFVGGYAQGKNTFGGVSKDSTATYYAYHTDVSSANTAYHIATQLQVVGTNIKQF